MGAPRQLVVAITLVLAFPAASLAQIRVLMYGGFSAAYHELLPQFEKTTGITVATATGASQGTGPDTIRWTVTYDDPVYYAKPWTVTLKGKREKYDIMEMICMDNNQDMPHYFTSQPNPAAQPKK